MTGRTRMKPDDRKQQMLEAGLSIVLKHGVKGLTRQALAEKSGATDGLVNHYFGRRSQMRQIILAEGIYNRKDKRVLDRALEAGFKVEKIPKELRAVVA